MHIVTVILHRTTPTDSLPPASRYCGIHSAASVVKCVKSGKWFCNARVTSTASCIVTHLVRAIQGF
jgi:regulator of nonsense transcripts 1